MFNPSANFVSSTFWIYPKYDHFSPTPLVTTLISDDHLQKLLGSVLASICDFCGSFSISRKSYHSVLLSNKIPSHWNCSAGGPGLIPGSGSYPGEGNGNPLQYSCLENSMEVLLHGELHSLEGYNLWAGKEYNLWARQELDRTERLKHTEKSPKVFTMTCLNLLPSTSLSSTPFTLCSCSFVPLPVASFLLFK